LETQNYVGLEIRDEVAAKCQENFPSVKIDVGDIQNRTQYPDDHFDRIIAIHVLEHIRDLPSALKEMKRILKPGGICDIVLPCEGGLAYWFARQFISKRYFEKRYNMEYKWFIEREHVSTIGQVLYELKTYGFIVKWKRFYPIPVPTKLFNLAAGFQCLAPQ
jgi:SAM-dependent methyltransferase